MSKTSAPRGACVRVLGMALYSRRANGNRAHSLPAARRIPNLAATAGIPVRPYSPALLLGQAFAQPGQDELRDQPADVAAVPGDLLHQARPQERVQRVGGHEQRLDLG